MLFFTLNIRNGFENKIYEILDDNTQIIESKNGPFVDVETDKTKF